ncbi:MAG TPA: CoA pyrophosphatase [Patescibacteria group bacterium]|nr:CoA pyrophosphatase [Patescibacteria group bacterium]
MAERFDIERVHAALHDLAQPPSGPGWNRAQLADVLPDPARLAPAAVLVGIVERAVPTILLTRRTESLATHGGQVSFPGGRIDPEDVDAIAAALREADEEVGLDARFVAPIGFLDPFETISAYRVLPVVARVRPGFVLSPNPDEVAEAFEAPLSLFLDHSAHRVQYIEYRGLRREIHEFEFAGHRIWGATAAMLINLRDRLERLR